MDEIAQEFQPGQRVRPFEILRLLYKGGQADVYLARPWQPDVMPYDQLLKQLQPYHETPEQIERHKLCVLKIAHPDGQDHLLNEWDFLQFAAGRHERLIRTFTQRFGNVLSANRRLKNDQAYADVTTINGTQIKLPYIALAYEAGGSLKHALEQRNLVISPACAVQIVIQIGEVLQHLHERVRLVHHDVSLSNILLRSNSPLARAGKPDAVLIDLAAADSLDRPRQRQIFGRRPYLPPERMRGEPVSPQVDIYALGMVLYVLLAGGLPDQTSTNPLNAQPRQQPEPVLEKNPRVSAELNELVMHAIDRNAEQRQANLPSMRQMVERLRSVPEAQQTCALRTENSLPIRRIVVAVVATVVVAVLLSGVLLIGPNGEPPPEPTPTPTSISAPPQPSVTTIPTPPTATPAPTETDMPTSTVGEEREEGEEN